MGTRLYVGNLAYAVRDKDLQDAFGAFGTVVSAKVMMERDNPNRSKGFGFVEMSTDEEGKAAVAGLHDQPVGGRNIVCNEARPMEDRPPRREGGFGGSRDFGDRPPRREGGFGGGGYGDRPPRRDFGDRPPRREGGGGGFGGGGGGYGGGRREPRGGDGGSGGGGLDGGFRSPYGGGGTNR